MSGSARKRFGYGCRAQADRSADGDRIAVDPAEQGFHAPVPAKLVGDALRGNPTPDDGFSMRLFERMKREGVKREPGFDPLKD